MPKSLLEQLPEIVARGRKRVEKILESPEGRCRAVRNTSKGDVENAAAGQGAVEGGCLVDRTLGRAVREGQENGKPSRYSRKGSGRIAAWGYVSRPECVAWPRCGRARARPGRVAMLDHSGAE